MSRVDHGDDREWSLIVEQLRADADTRYRRREALWRLVIIGVWMFPLVTWALLVAAVWAWVST